MTDFRFENVKGLFPTPLYRVNLDDDFRREVSIVKQIPTKMTRANGASMMHLYTENTFVLNLPEMRRLREMLSKHATRFMNDVLHIRGNAFITQSWGNCNKPGQGTHTHTHGNSIVSGVYYMDVPVGANITFHREKAENGYQMLPARMNDDEVAPSEFAWSWFRQEVVTGDLVLFPSYFPHSVDENTTTHDRWSLAFNSVPDISLGTEDELTFMAIDRSLRLDGNP